MAKQDMARTSRTHFNHFYRIWPWQTRTWRRQAVPLLTISTEFCHGKAGHGKDKQDPSWQFLQNFAMAKQDMAWISSTQSYTFHRILPWQSRTWQGQAVPTLTISTEFCHGCRQVSADKLCEMDSMVSPLWLKGACMSNCNLPPALLAKWLGSLTWCCSNMGWNRHWNKSPHKRREKFSGCFSRDSHLTFHSQVWHSTNELCLCTATYWLDAVPHPLSLPLMMLIWSLYSWGWEDGPDEDCVGFG